MRAHTIFVSAILAILANAGCSSTADSGADEELTSGDQVPRGPLGKADSSGSCKGAGSADYCGGASSGTCYCDDACTGYGDCCADYVAVCKPSNPPPGPGGDALSCDQAGNVCESSPAGAAAYRVYREALRDDGKIDELEANQLAAFLRGSGGGNASVKAFLQKVAESPDALFGASAKQVLTSYLGGTPPNWVPLENSVYRLKAGNQQNSVIDDKIYLVGEGKLYGSTDSSSHSRGYAKKAAGILRFPHGSKAPAHPLVDSSSDTDRLLSQSPAVALDTAAAAAGLQLGQFGFDYRANKRFYDSNAQYWEGLCHAWSYGALEERINALVDVDGPTGQRGIWIFGQWLSRADLGNWMMAVSDQLSVADTELVDPYVTPVDILKGVSQWVMTSGLGLRADMFNDAEQGSSEVWNQPIVDAQWEVAHVSQSAADAVVAYAKNDAQNNASLPATPMVELVKIRVSWGAEVNDAHEGAPSLQTNDWNMYVITHADGEAVVGYMAHHLRNANVSGLPVTESDPLPDYFAYPKNTVMNAAFEGGSSSLLVGALDGPVFRFFVGTVLAYGVPETMRKSFEADFAASSDAATLKQKYPGIANAYTSEQWDRVFATKLGPGVDFGARWGTFSNPG